MLAGIGVGIVGIVLLVAPSEADLATVDPLGAMALLGACLFWATGSLYSRRAPRSGSAPRATAVEMLAGGIALLILSASMGEVGRFEPSVVSARSVLAWAYLVVFGSLILFSAYMWLLRVTTAAAVSTYAFVNPVVAIVLGTAIGGERLGSRALLASALVLVAVVCLHVSNVTRARRRSQSLGAAPSPRRAAL